MKRCKKLSPASLRSPASIDEAIRQQADAVIVHHGYFLKGESPVIRGVKRNPPKGAAGKRYQSLWLAPAAYGALPQLGNNAQLAQLLAINIQGEIEARNRGRTVDAGFRP
ncbi:Nif3-like dinuclear metal center hexameric protein [Shigella flexneri]